MMNSVNMFGTDILVQDGMVRFKDIQDAFLDANPGIDPEATWFKVFRRNKSTKTLLKFLSNEYSKDDYWNRPLHMDSRKGGLFGTLELAHAYACWLDPRHIYYMSNPLN